MQKKAMHARLAFSLVRFCGVDRVKDCMDKSKTRRLLVDQEHERHRSTVCNLRRLGRIQLGMNTLEQEYTDLLNEYRMALRLWTEVRALYSPDAPEVTAAANHLEALEQELGTFSRPLAA
jgi:hypothetical protein